MNNVAEFTSVTHSSKPFKIGSIKNNRWVMYEGKIGIITGMVEKSDTAIFNEIGDDGTTVASIPVDPFALIEATWMNIPEIRRPTKEIAYKLGYAIPEDAA